MTDETQALLDALAQRRGLGEAYYDHRGELRHFSRAARRAILQSMGAPVDDVEALRRALEQTSLPLVAGGHPSGQDAPTLALPRETGEGSNTCFQPPILSEKKCWGLSIQLYTLRSTRNWGIGDFDDLRELIASAAPLGCDVIGLNPLHALFPADPTHCSPYSPSSRLFLNAMYIAVETVPEFATCAAARELCSQESFQAALAALRANDNVMYEQVTTLKLCVLRLLHSDFRESHVEMDSTRARAYHEFVARGGASLRLHAIFDALDSRFRSQHGGGWQTWPEEYRDPQSEAVREFAEQESNEVDLFLYLQWLADEQLAEAQRFARQQGMKIGLYGDLAVGANPDGSEVWANHSLYVRGASVGAPPDPLALNGQDWGIPPIDPHALRAQGLQPFVELLRDTMRHVGALRIDHVMSLFRLWWVPRGFSSVEGVYVHYPLHELVSVLSHESHRAQCLVIGEDLGTVPDEVRMAMETSHLYHYKVLLFEREGSRFKAPHEYVRHAVATATTHDLPPLKAWWQGDDLALRDRLMLYPSTDTARQLHEERTTDRRELLLALTGAGLWYWQPHESFPDFSPALARAIHLYLGRTNAALALLQLEDLIGMTDPVNVPGTHTEHANWQRKLTMSTAEIFAKEDVRETLVAVGKARAGIEPNG